MQFVISLDDQLHQPMALFTYGEGLVTKEVDLIKVLLHKLQAVCLVPALHDNRATSFARSSLLIVRMQWPPDSSLAMHAKTNMTLYTRDGISSALWT